MPEIEISEADEVRARHLVPAATTMAMVPVVESRRKELARSFAEVRIAERERIVAKLSQAREQLREAHGNETAAGFDWAIAILTGGKATQPNEARDEQ